MNSFESIVTIEDISKNKPDPEGLYRILHTCKVSRSRALFTGIGREILKLEKELE